MDWFKKRKHQQRLNKFFGNQCKKKKEEPPPKPIEVRKPPRFKCQLFGKGTDLENQIFSYWNPKPPVIKPFHSGRHFVYYLCKKKGYKCLGSGAFSTVIGKEGSNKVLKVTYRPWDRWIEYCKWAAENGYAGGFAPKVYSYKLFKSDESFSVSVVERLDKTFHRVEGNTDAYLFGQLAKWGTEYKNTLAITLADLVTPGSGKFLTEFKDTFSHTFDFHGGNIMTRTDGSVCFSDPVADNKQEIIVSRMRGKDFASKEFVLSKLSLIRENKIPIPAAPSYQI